MIYTILMGGAAGYLAGQIMKGKGFGILMNVFVGVAGSIFGRIIFRIIGISLGGGIIGNLLTATIGAVLLVVIVNLIKGKK